jgi:hypothetical protein
LNFSLLIALARVLDFLLLLKVVSGLDDRSRFNFRLERISTVETLSTMAAASTIFCSSLRAFSSRMLDVCMLACKIFIILLVSRPKVATAGHLAALLLVKQ